MPGSASDLPAGDVRQESSNEATTGQPTTRDMQLSNWLGAFTNVKVTKGRVRPTNILDEGRLKT